MYILTFSIKHVKKAKLLTKCAGAYPGIGQGGGGTSQFFGG